MSSDEMLNFIFKLQFLTFTIFANKKCNISCLTVLQNYSPFFLPTDVIDVVNAIIKVMSATVVK